MARRKERAPSGEFSETEPPPNLIFFKPREGHRWTGADFASWLRAWAAWRDSHLERLPQLAARERVRLNQYDLLAGLVQAERPAAKDAPAPRYRPQSQGVDRPTHVAWSHPELEEHAQGE
jgi:hypothetical protein